MTLSLILSGKGGDVVTTSPEQTLRAVAQTLSEKGIGAVLVTDPEQRLLGIISERDIVRAIAGQRHDVLEDPVSNHMTARVVTATGATSVAEAMGSMTKGRFRHLPVLKSEKVVGIVSIGDLVKQRLSEMETENKAMLDYITAA